MQVLEFTAGHEPITLYQSQGAYALPLAQGRGEGHVYCIRFAPGGAIGPHEASFGQLFLVVAGSGWVSGGDGVPRSLGVGQAAVIARGEVHSKGSEPGMTAIMLQLTDLAAAPTTKPTAW
jgi:quercetin dioxygenase-like cupin family protein